jgi:ABC-2 type transport system ATP-binding protein
MSHSTLRDRIPALLDMVGLTPHRDKQLREFSKGMLQRIGLAQALLNDPELIFLDEPTSGLDPLGRRMVRDIIKTQRERGATVILNSHLLGEVEISCDRVAFIKEGEVVETRLLKDQSEEQTIVTIRAGKLTEEIVRGLATWATSSRSEGERLTLSLSSNAALPDVVRYLAEKGADIYEVTPLRLSLEERFLQIVGSDGGM